MTLSGKVVSAAAGLHGFDADVTISADKAKLFKQAGFAFCVRYLTRGAGQAKSDLGADEANGILDAGLGLMAVQHVSKSGWSPTAKLGSSYGGYAASNAQEVGLPPGINLWLDLEGVNHSAASEDVIAYCNAWFDTVNAAGYVGGIYVGANAVLSGDELFWRLKTQHYWQSGSAVPALPERGYQMSQRIVAGDVVNGIEIDRNLTKTDSFGGAVLWLIRS